LRDFPLLDDRGQEIPIYDSNGARIRRRDVGENEGVPPCGVLVNLATVQALFDPYTSSNHDPENSSTVSSELDDAYAPKVDVYPLGFLRTVGNLQANGIPPCFYPLVTEINQTVGKQRRQPESDRSWWDDEPTLLPEDPEDEEEEEEEEEADGSRRERVRSPTVRAVKPVSCQFYNYMMHRVATRAGQYDSQQGTVTAAVSGAFATTDRHRDVAFDKQTHCDRGLPSERFHSRFSLEDCPTSCRAEFVYSVDVRALDDPSGRHVYEFRAPPPPRRSFACFACFVSFLRSFLRSFSPVLLCIGQIHLQRHRPSPGEIVEPERRSQDGDGASRRTQTERMSCFHIYS
jgi:hypothetical protein